MSRAIVFDAYGPPDVLKIIDLDVGVPRREEVKVVVRSAGVQPFDCLFRSGGAGQAGRQTHQHPAVSNPVVNADPVI
ncbi:hypothetical protein GA0061102_105127 [Rhizobium miluonense]|uniref:Uncharacterized protein n=1 Tax=Rhizobium miluonense TaxID=411945 RepID=A0A1C3X1B7_9HYPH|nr:hypothetical protein GA0061102_105127 [Rhizobium miluonense]